MLKINVNSPAFNNLVAQMGHFGWGALIFLAFALHTHWAWGILGVFAWAAPKEFIFDALIESQTFKNNLFDFSMYCAGLATGLALFFIGR